MKLRIGPPVTGEDFYPRPHLIQTLTRALNGGHVAFLGPRRTGKTSCLKSMVGNPPAGYVPLLLNLEKHHSITDWLKDMVAANHDGYLLQAAGGEQRTGFASHILRDYWRRKTS